MARALRREQRTRRTRQQFIVFGQPCITAEDISAVTATLKSRWIGMGPRVTEFEEAIRRYKGAAHAVALNSCTAGLHLACRALGIGPGDEVIVPAMTFCATVNAVIHCGASPVLADVDPATMNISPEEVERRITSRTRAVVVVHFAGRPCDMTAICRIARRHRIELIEDCAHALETTYKGRHAGLFGSAGVLSFYATKNITTGEGGMLLTNSARVARRVRRLCLHGLSADAWKRYGDAGYRHYYVIEAGYKYNMTDMQAALGIQQFARLARMTARRRKIWDLYQEAFRETPLILPPPEEPGTTHARHLYTVLVDPRRCGITRDRFLTAMTAKGIGVGVHYLSIAEHPFYRKRYGWRPAEWPHAMRIGRQTVSLPLSGCLSDADAHRVVSAVRACLQRP